jgi:hypothetical protein
MYGGDTSFGRTKARDAHRVPVESPIERRENGQS